MNNNTTANNVKPTVALVVDGITYDEVVGLGLGASAEMVWKGDVATTTSTLIFTTSASTTGTYNLDLYFKSSFSVYLRSDVATTTSDTVTAYIHYERS